MISLDKDTTYFLAMVFTLSYALEAYIIYCFMRGDYATSYVLLFLLMYIPCFCASFVAVGIRGEEIRKYGVEFGDVKYYPIAHIYPIVFILLAAILMHVVGFEIDWSLKMYREQTYGSLVEHGGPAKEPLIATILIVIAFAPILNMIFAVGEEIGWRGYLFDKMLARNSLESTILFVGTIWALWHAPLIIFIGYNYRTLRGLGLLIFIPFCISHGTILAWLRYKSKGILAPALGHGSINATSFLGYYLYPHSDLYSLVVGIPAVIVCSIFAYIAYIDLKKHICRNANMYPEAPKYQHRENRVSSSLKNILSRT